MSKASLFFKSLCLSLTLLLAVPAFPKPVLTNSDTEKKIDLLLGKMSLKEKIGQMYMHPGEYGNLSEDLKARIRDGQIGSILNEVDPKIVTAIQDEAKKSKHQIPLIMARDVIHGFRTIFPIPLGLAATFNPTIVEETARVSAIEARTTGVTWTFAPMLDVTRDPRWGRVAESPGEDPYLASLMGAAMVRGFQNDFKPGQSLAACAKHFVAYGAVESGKDYNTVVVSQQQLHDLYLPPFKAAIDSGSATIMTAFNEINGVPATANEYTLNEILKTNWGFTGMVVSDWGSTENMINHGYSKDLKMAARQSIKAGVDMEMVYTAYIDHLEQLVADGVVDERLIDDAVRRILRIKFKIGLFENPYPVQGELLAKASLELAKQAAMESMVLLTNKGGILPLKKGIKKVAIIGPMAHAPHDQLGTWVFDGKKEDTITPMMAFKEHFGEENILFEPALSYSRDFSKQKFGEAVQAAENSDAILLFLGEESILSGEAHSRVFLNLPGAQLDLLKKLKLETNKPIIVVILAGRPLVLTEVSKIADAILYAWHPGTMGGAAIVELVTGAQSPSGKLPISFPRAVGQIPVYYNHKSTGRPPSGNYLSMDKIKVGTNQVDLENRAVYLDVETTPLFPFGHGLTYGKFSFHDLSLKSTNLKVGESIEVKFKLTNRGKFKAKETIQVYINDPVASLTRPVKELVAIKQVELEPGNSRVISLEVPYRRLGFHNSQGKFVIEPGDYKLYIGSESQKTHTMTFKVLR